MTSLTISRQSESFLTDLIERLALPCKVLSEDFWEHRSAELYAIVIHGVMEHLPDYPAVLKHLRNCPAP